jgi:tRNA pseudouridine(38-40) synthase
MPGQVAGQADARHQIRRQGDLIIFTLKASAFLHHMVRNLVGSLVYIGQGREDVTWMAELLAAKTARRRADLHAGRPVPGQNRLR